jgi:hypothetical protein
MVYVNIAPYLQEGDAKKAHDSIIALWRRTTDSPELLEHTPPSSIIQVEQRIEPVDKRELPGKRSARMI